MGCVHFCGRLVACVQLVGTEKGAMKVAPNCRHVALKDTDDLWGCACCRADGKSAKALYKERERSCFHFEALWEEQPTWKVVNSLEMPDQRYAIQQAYNDLPCIV